MMEKVAAMNPNIQINVNEFGVVNKFSSLMALDNLDNCEKQISSADYEYSNRTRSSGKKDKVLTRRERTLLRNKQQAITWHTANARVNTATIHRDNRAVMQEIHCPEALFVTAPRFLASLVEIYASLLPHTPGRYAGTSPLAKTQASTLYHGRGIADALAAGSQTLLGNVDRKINHLFNNLLPWQGVAARPVLPMPLSPRATPRPVAFERVHYSKTVARLRDNYPQLYLLASQYIKKSLLKKYHLEVDPDRTWFHRFDYASSSSATYTGWEHNVSPRESKTLTERLLANYGAEDQLNADELSANAGIYTADRHAESFGAANEVKLLPKDFLNLVKESDFSRLYFNKLNAFWLKNSSAFRTVSKGRFIALLGQNTSRLSSVGLHNTMMATLGDIRSIPDMTVAELERKVLRRPGLTLSTFDIYGYHASDMFLIHNAKGEMILYCPSDRDSFIEFGNTQTLRNWIVTQAKDPEKREALANHFSLYDRQDGYSFAGVDFALHQIANANWDPKYVHYEPQSISGDVFTWLSRQAELRTLSDAKTLTTTNNEVFKQKLLANLKSAADMAALSALFLPSVGGLVLMGVGITQAGLGVDLAINGDTERQRKMGLADLFNGGVNTLFGGLGASERLLEGDADFDPGEVEPINIARADGDSDHYPQRGLFGGMQHWQPPKPVLPARGNFINRLFKQSVVNARGLAALNAKNALYGARMTTTLADMENTLRLAGQKIRTRAGEEIVAQYLGYENADLLPASKLDVMKQTITELDIRRQWLQNFDKGIKWVTICDPERVNTYAYYNFNKDVIAFDDTFFRAAPKIRLHAVIHESMHAGVKDNGGKVLDYFYLSRIDREEGIIYRRNQQLEISQARVDADYLLRRRGTAHNHYFINKMAAGSIKEAIEKFLVNLDLRSELLLKNPDTQATLLMELADDLWETKNTDNSMWLPWLPKE